MHRLLLILPLVFLSVACSGYDKRTYSLEVKNNSAKPITIGLTKNGPPMEVEWESPADRAIMDPRNTGIGWGMVVPPGKTAVVDNLQGEFHPQTSAFLRIYLGDLALNDILALGKDSRHRTDIRLREGKTSLVVVDKGPFIDAHIASWIPGGEEAKHSPALRPAP